MANEQADAGAFSRRYFENYDGAGRSYAAYMKLGVIDPRVFHAHISALGLAYPRSMLDLGAADGSALLYFQTEIPSLTTLHGVEISAYAYAHRKIEHLAFADIRDLLKAPPAWMLPKYDVVLMAAAMYLREAEVIEVFAAIRRYCHPAQRHPYHDARAVLRAGTL